MIMSRMKKAKIKMRMLPYKKKLYEEEVKDKGVYIAYSNVNQAYFVMFYKQILRIFNTKKEAKSYLTEISNI